MSFFFLLVAVFQVCVAEESWFAAAQTCGCDYFQKLCGIMYIFFTCGDLLGF